MLLVTTLHAPRSIRSITMIPLSRHEHWWFSTCQKCWPEGKAQDRRQVAPEVHVVKSQPNLDIPVFFLHREDGRGKDRTLHRNVLLLVGSVPTTSPKTLHNPVDPLFSCASLSPSRARSTSESTIYLMENDSCIVSDAADSDDDQQVLVPLPAHFPYPQNQQQGVYSCRVPQLPFLIRTLFLCSFSLLMIRNLTVLVFIPILKSCLFPILIIVMWTFLSEPSGNVLSSCFVL